MSEKNGKLVGQFHDGFNKLHINDQYNEKTLIIQQTPFSEPLIRIKGGSKSEVNSIK